MQDLLLYGLFPLICAFAVVAIVGPAFIPWLHKLKFGQEIREEGPKWHQKKSGTPTMGGIMFMLGISVAVAAACLIAFFSGDMTAAEKKALLVLFISLGFGIIGFIDDFIKVVKKRNLGLRALPKLLLQVGFTGVYMLCLNLLGGLSTEIIIPFTSLTIPMPMWLYMVFAFVVVVGTVNAVNLTDGLDGLASSVTIPAAIFFAVCGAVAGELGIYTYGLAVVGGLLGFLIYNKYPAKVFMGDTGSLFLGGSIAAMAIALQMHLYILIAGFIYFAEALSVILQVASFKLTGKRIFKMSPIHHHFEMCGWNEKKIVAVFTSVTAVLCIVTLILINI